MGVLKDTVLGAINGALLVAFAFVVGAPIGVPLAVGTVAACAAITSGAGYITRKYGPSQQHGGVLDQLVQKGFDAHLEHAQELAKAAEKLAASRDSKLEELAVNAQNVGHEVANRLRNMKGSS